MQKYYSILIACSISIMALLFILLPQHTLYASVRGLQTWFDIVFPSLLPFFIMSELLMMYGIVQAIGILSEPIMRPFFRVPGSGSFAFVVGMASGYPLGAKITASLREKNYINQIEAERLLTFSNAASPLFLFGVIAISFFHDKYIGILLALSHYTSNIFVGLCMKFYYANKPGTQKVEQHSNISIRALRAIHKTRILDKRAFGEKLGDAVQSSIQTLLIIGGFIILFSVITHLLHTIYFFEKVMEPFVPTSLKPVVTPFFTGLFEITTGTELIASLHSVPTIIKLCAVSFILGFHSLSIQAQVASVISKTDIRFSPYFFGRLLQSIFSVLITYCSYQVFFSTKIKEVTSTEVANIPTVSYYVVHFFQQYGFYITSFTLCIYLIIKYRRIT